MIDPRRNKILVRDRVRNKNESASVYAVWAIRAWIKGKVRLDERTHCDHRPVCQLAITGVTGCRAIIGCGIARHHGKLLDRIHSENASLDAARGAGSLVVDAHASQPVIILLGTIAADGDVNPEAAVRTVVIDRKRFLRTHLRNTWF